jgi:hypothetical protein
MSARGRACEKCDFFEAFEHEKLKNLGLCRKAHPERQWMYRPGTLSLNVTTIHWPLINGGDWCGEFEEARVEDAPTPEKDDIDGPS